MSVDILTRLLLGRMLLLRHETKYLGLSLRSLARRNASATASIVAPDGPVVSLTTYGERFKTVHLTIESIAAGNVLPSRLILWVDEVEAFHNPTPGLKRLMNRGLELLLTENYGPHTKYYPYVLSQPVFNGPLVTADDDLLYPRWWLAKLVEAHRLLPGAVNCFRVHRVHLDQQGVAPYLRWTPCCTAEPSLTHFGTGVSGCIYPAQVLEGLRRSGTKFLTTCPQADDVWLHVHALRAGIPVRQIRTRGLRFPFIPGTQTSGLYHNNVVNAGNDQQIRQTYTAHDVALLRQADAPISQS